MKRVFILVGIIMGIISPSVFGSKSSQELEQLLINRRVEPVSIAKKVAVYMTGDEINESYKKVIGQKLVSVITKSDDYVAVERTADFLNAIKEEEDYGLSGEIRDSQIARLGQKFGVKFVVVADVSEVFDEIYIASRLINVETGLVEGAYETYAVAENLTQLSSLAETVADGLLLEPIRAIKEQKRLEEEQRIAQEEERKRKVAEEKKRKREELRERAIRNLMPANTILCGNYIVLDHVLPVRIFINPERQNRVDMSVRIPNGFKFADGGILDKIGKYTSFINDKEVIVSMHTMAMNEGWHTRKKFKYSTMEGEYTTVIRVVQGYNRNQFLAKTEKKNGKLTIVEERPKNAVVYRDFFTENEILAEMKRIARNEGIDIDF